jgi:Domain of unknown function (DUF4388)
LKSAYAAKKLGVVMQNNRFVVLTGHLSNYPLSDLIGILRHQRKSGRLLIEYPKGPATLFFEEGDLVDVRLNELSGLQAICVLTAQPDASFNFNPLIKASQRTIEPNFQRVVSELFGCWDESAILIESSPVGRRPALEPPEELNTDRPALQGREPLALPPAPPAFQQRSLFLIAAAVLIVVAISTVIAVTGRLGRTTPPTTAAQVNAPVASASNQIGENKSPQSSTRGSGARNRQQNYERRESRMSANKSQESDQSEGVNAASEASSTGETKQAGKANHSAGSIKVIMQIENGRVLKASIANHEPGMDSYEALALRIARQRRYPVNKTGAEAVTITVNKPE